jgi:hypothetical protein
VSECQAKSLLLKKKGENVKEKERKKITDKIETCVLNEAPPTTVQTD